VPRYDRTPVSRFRPEEIIGAVSFGPQVCGRLDEGSAREWLVPDGLGGYAMGTVTGLRTRRYHGLLVVAGSTPATRHLGLAALDPVVTLPSGAVVRLATHEWADGTVAPQGHTLLESFDLTDGLPRWRWRIGDVVIERELATTHGRAGVAVVHRLLAGGPVGLRLQVLVTWRDVHGERTAGGPAPRVAPAADGCTVEEAFRLTGPGFEPGGGWWRGVHHRDEAARGLQPREDLWYAGSFVTELPRAGSGPPAPPSPASAGPGSTDLGSSDLGSAGRGSAGRGSAGRGSAAQVSVWAGDLGDRPAPAADVVAAARRRNRALLARGQAGGPTAATLTLAADAFVVRTAAGPDVVAGYPWFGAWSRDTMISYEGLFLATGRADEGRDLLRGYAATLSEGMLANTADTGGVEYNTADGTLWFLHAVGRHVARTGDTDLAAELLPALHGVIDAHLRGTRYGIRVDPADGLLRQGAPGEALTWMDARVDGVPVTPRHGKPVEINALWINGLAVVSALCDAVGASAGPGSAGGPTGHRPPTGADPATVLAHAAASASFARRFPAPTGWLHDVIDGPDGDDATLRPNQLLAWSLPHAPLRPDPAVLRVVGAALMTPLGPRSLAPAEPGYRPTHRGTSAQRDGAYHQGTVWPWLIGPYADALRIAGLDDSGLLIGIAEHLSEFGLGSISETADAVAPHGATGCPFQAWSVAETLRILLDS
jgi:glycogen debranching enzyme